MSAKKMELEGGESFFASFFLLLLFAHVVTDDALFQLIRSICEHFSERSRCIDCKKAGTGGG